MAMSRGFSMETAEAKATETVRLTDVREVVMAKEGVVDDKAQQNTDVMEKAIADYFSKTEQQNLEWTNTARDLVQDEMRFLVDTETKATVNIMPLRRVAVALPRNFEQLNGK